MRAFVTVGSTRFDTLVACVFTPSVLSSLRDKGYKEVVIQCGNSNFELAGLLNEREGFSSERCGVQIECWRFKSTLNEEFERADLVISHAGKNRRSFERTEEIRDALPGSGTILDVLRLGKPLIVVPNQTLLDDHQQELAAALEEMNHLRVSGISCVFMNISGIVKSLVMQGFGEDRSGIRSSSPS